MIWVGLAFILGLIALPWALELMRHPVSRLREGRTGSLVALSQGITQYDWRGPETGPVVVCVHGLSTPAFVWDGVAQHLADSGCRVLTYDLYGRGGSDRARGAQNGAFFASQFLDLLEAEGIEAPVTLIGYSMGGAIGAYVAAHHPDHVRQAVLVDPAGLGHDLGGFSAFAARSGVLGNWLQVVMAGRKLRGYIAGEATRITPALPDIHARMAEETKAQGYAMAVLSSLRHILSGDLEQAHRQIAKHKTPVLAIWGAEDDLIPLSGRDWLTRLNPDARHVVMENCGHEIPYVHPQELTEHITGFLKSPQSGDER